jgi:hypothetical protein
MLIISVPHAAVKSPVERDVMGQPEIEQGHHHTDWLAEPAAKLLHKKLPNSVLLIGDINRVDIDLNRKESRKTAFRQNLEKVIKQQKYPPMVLDIHSANGNFFGTAELTLIQPHAEAWPDYMVKGVATGKAGWRRSKYVENYTNDFVEYMNRNGVRTNIYHSWPPTADLIFQSRSLGAGALLIEFNEAVIRNEKHLESVVDVLASWAKRIE